MGPFLTQGQALRVGDFLQSPNGAYRAILRDTGNVDIVRQSDGAVLRSTFTKQPPRSDYVFGIYGDGNVCASSNEKRGYWCVLGASKSDQVPYTLALSDDGKLTATAGTPSTPVGSPYWSL